MPACGVAVAAAGAGGAFAGEANPDGAAAEWAPLVCVGAAGATREEERRD